MRNNHSILQTSQADFNKPADLFRAETTINFYIPGHCGQIQLSVSEAKDLVKSLNKELSNIKLDKK